MKTVKLTSHQVCESACPLISAELVKMQQQKDTSYTEVIGLRFRDQPLDEVADSLVSDARNGVRREVLFVNAHCVNVAARNESYRSILRDAPFVYADGAGIAMAAWIWGAALENNVNGSDLFPILCEKAARNDVPIALLGALPGIAEACAENMKKLYPGLRVVWTQHGYASDEDETNLLNDIGRSGARILLVAKGVPLQELWIKKNSSNIDVPVIMGVGALFDFYSGAMRRSPLFIRKLRMEWVFRFLLEPRRLFRRYIIGNPEFLLRVLRMRFSRKL